MLRTILNEKENINDSIKAGGLRPENENEKINAIICAPGAKKHSFITFVVIKRKVRTALGQHSG